METTIVYRGYIGNNGKENGNYYRWTLTNLVTVCTFERPGLGSGDSTRGEAEGPGTGIMYGI